MDKSPTFPTIFDLLELDGDEDDDEYNPAEEEEAEDEEEEEVVEDLFMGDPKHDNPTTEPEDVEMSGEERSEGDMIARRTRSQFQIEEEPKDTLEFPDVTEDLYELVGADGDGDEWLQFLNSLYQDNPSKNFDEDEAKDPDYSVFAGVDQLSVNGGKDQAQTVDVLPIEPVEKIDITSLSSSDLSEWSKFFTKEDIELLYHQMSQHIQLLAQQYLLTMTSQTLGSIAETASFLIKEINQFASCKDYSLFKTPNLAGALKIMEENSIKPSGITVTAKSWRQCPVPLTARPVFADNPHVFRYHDLLPKNGYPDVTVNECPKVRTKTKFTKAEDHLIALGLEQFKDVEKKLCYQYIRQLLLPVKSKEQIRMHVKNKRRHLKKNPSKKDEETSDEIIDDESNPVTYFLKHGKLIEIDRKTSSPQENFLRLDELPEWLAKQIDPKYSTSDSSITKPHLKLSPIKGVYSRKYQISGSPHKQTNAIRRKYRYLTKYPYIKPKLNQSQSKEDVTEPPITSGITVISIENPVTNEVTFTTAELMEETNEEDPPILSERNDASIIPDGIEGEKEDTSISVEPSNENPKSCESPPSEPPENDGTHEGNAERDLDPINQNENDDDESDLFALMMASSTITSHKGRNKSHDTQGTSTNKKEAKKSLLTKHKESTVLLLSEDWLLNDYSREQKEQIMVQCFMSKVREVLKSDDDYVQFLTYLSEFGQQRAQKESIKDLHRKTEKLLRKANAQQVIEEFVLLLNASEAQECGRMYQYLHWRRYLSFIRKLEVYSLVEPNCIPRLHKTLIQLKSSETPVNKQRLKSAVSKAISGHPYLINEFSSLFLDEKPKDHLFASDEDFDHLNISNAEEMGSEVAKTDDVIYENVSIDLNLDEKKYGTNECPCKHCHPINLSSEPVESDKRGQPANGILRHCVACSLRFIGGKVYIQGAKKTQPAEVQYLGKEYKTKATNQKPNRSNSSILPPSHLNGVSGDESTKNSTVDKQSEKPWSLTDDKLLLELCKARVSSDDEANLIELFQEIACKLDRPYDKVIERFNKLIEIFKNETKVAQEPEITSESMEIVSEGVT